MVVTDSELADKIVYLKENGFKPNLDKESLNVQTTLNSFYNCEKTNKLGTDKFDEDPFWFRLVFCNYNVSDEFVREVNREYKRYQILNLGKGEF